MYSLWLTLLFSSTLIIFAIVLILQSKKRELNEKANRHFIVTAGLKIDGRREIEQSHTATLLERQLKRAGVELRQRHALFILIFITMMTIVVIQTKGLLLGCLVPISTVIGIYLWLWRRANNRIKAMLNQLPLFLDQVLRSLGAGRSMETALQVATTETPEPLKEVFERVLRVNNLGYDLGLSIQEMADLYRIRELYLVSLAIRVNRTYGTSVRELLNNIAKMIHEREAARRELKTMTGETRVTAWVLGLLPIAIGMYILFVNPEYMQTMLEDAAGKMMLSIAILLQLIGGFILWRMIKSI